MRAHATPWLVGLAIAMVGAGCKSEKKVDPASPATPSASVATGASAAANAAGAATPSPGKGGVTRVEVSAKTGDELGYALAASGGRVAASAWKRGGSEGSHPGSVLVFQRDGAKLTLETELTADKSHQLGNNIALGDDVLVVGAMFDDGSTKEAGAAYVFSRGASGWSKAQKLVDRAGKADDSFGIGVALAGPSVIVSNTRETGGSLFVFEQGKNGFEQKQALGFPEPVGPAEAVGASNDVLVVGAPNAAKQEAGLLHVYARGKAGFEHAAKLAEADPADEQHFGGSVAASPDTLAVTSEKQITLLRKKDGKWTELTRLTPPETTALADAGLVLGEHVLLVGLPRVEEGRVLVYEEHDGSWKLARTLSPPDGQKDDWFGYSLALTPDSIVIGAPLKDNRTGALYTVAR